ERPGMEREERREDGAPREVPVETAGAPEQARVEPNGAARMAETPAAPLFHEPQAQEFRSQWATIQTGFVDNPREAVQQADNLVAQTIKRLAEIFAQERDQLEQQWSRGDNVSTEDLRIAMQRYRSFFDRLLSV